MLDEEEFLRFFIKLTMNMEINKIMRLYSSKNNETFTAKDLQHFLVNEQQVYLNYILICNAVCKLLWAIVTLLSTLHFLKNYLTILSIAHQFLLTLNRNAFLPQ